MKKIQKIIILSALLMMISTIAASASSATSYTYAIDAKDQMVRTQDAYLPDRTITELLLNKPEDIFIDGEDFLYIADTGNKRIVKYNPKTDQIVMEIMDDEMTGPTGVYVTQEGGIYVSDSSASSIFHFSKEGALIEKFGKPDSPSFGYNDFNPMKVGVDEAGNMFVLGEGIYDGLIQLAHTGEFLGYFSSNKVALTWVQRLQDLFFTEQQKTNLLGRTPVTFSNVYVDNKGIVYSTTMGEDVEQGIKKHNTAGQSMIKSYIVSTDDMIDIFVGPNGIIYAVSKAGLIFVYTSDGEFIYVFGAFNPSQDISGLFSTLVSVAVDSEGKIWTLDKEKSFIQSFQPTEYANLIYTALDAFNNGLYQDSIDVWDDILKLNQMSVLAHNNIGKNYLFKQKYEEAMYHTEIAGNRFYYSQSYWEVRNLWLQRNLAFMILVLLGLFLLTKIIKWLDKRKHFLDGPKRLMGKIYAIKPIKDTLFVFKFFKHPLDSFYDLKLGNQGSRTGALILYALAFITYITSLLGKGFIYQLVAVEDVDLQSVTLGFFAISLLFVLCNYLVSAINDGEGSFV